MLEPTTTHRTSAKSNKSVNLNAEMESNSTLNGPTTPCDKKGKGIPVPLQAWSGPEGSRKLRFPDFITTAQDGGKFVSLMHRPPLPQGNTPGNHFC